MLQREELPRLAADTIRFLAADAVQKANSGHPGMPMGMADAAVALWRQFLRHNPSDPHWPNRDRFILSAGHGSMLLYSLLHLTGYDLPLAEIQQFRQWGSLTPGHPESHLTPGVETTTGPLGQGISNAVGFSLAEAWLAARFNRPEFPIVDHFTYTICSDGDLQEGIAHEACALAGHLGLGKLIALYDDNDIQIDGPTHLAFSENVLQRFEAYGWHTSRVDGHDPESVAEALRAAREVTDRPSLIACKTIIGFGSPNRAGTNKIHGEPMGEAEIRLTKDKLGWPADAHFMVPGEVREFLDAREAGSAAQEAWESLFAAYRATYPDLAAEFETMVRGDLPDGWQADLPAFAPGSSMATRAASGKVLEALVPRIPQMLGGSADLTGSNKTDVKGTGTIQKADMTGRYIHYGVREHGMGAIMNGMALHGGVIPYGGTFLVFSDYMRASIRLAALMEQQVIYVFTHDSIGLGEDGPTHQPVEQLMALRAMPNLWVIRPAEANETAAAWQIALERKDGPTALALTRQNLPTLESTVATGALRGGYAIGASPDDVAAILATGSEVTIALEAQARLAQAGSRVRVVSLPCWELFDRQDEGYRDSVLPATISARVSIEAGVTHGWKKYLGDRGTALGLDHFGASAPYETLYAQFGLTTDALEAAVKALLA